MNSTSDPIPCQYANLGSTPAATQATFNDFVLVKDNGVQETFCLDLVHDVIVDTQVRKYVGVGVVFVIHDRLLTDHYTNPKNS